ncbi:ABC transporter ATP-binding protein [Thomasclavelia ramosa]|uniref:ATP-binding cassette domain-containing protein n=1 Tax=Thomasclavelia ramosa TaxID=1547 RepID=UPI000E5397AE|nr:ABC transporter ATP-binding protein [Thomasclavelia ramosa]RGQ39115.1 ABC transporter ATP-binding protein [Thomasclavelia ramosa]RGQ53795.1 ABC transporter ATP-binding protein [Thomasclavelia ramosa]
MDTAIEFKHVKKVYGEKVIIDDFNLKITPGEFLTVVGSSGCGKTTILKMINGLIIPDEGQVLVHDQCTQAVDLIELRRGIGYAIQGSVLFPHMTVAQNIAYVPNLLNKNDKKRTYEALSKWMKIVGLGEELIHRYPSELSGGQQQRVGIARALAASPDILLMDEPFGAVDEITRSTLQDEILRIHHQENITIIFVTHDINEALKLGSRIMVMDQGKVVQLASPREILEHPKTEFVRKLVQRKDDFL